MKIQHIPSPYDEAMGLTQNPWQVTTRVLGSARPATPQPQKASPQRKKKRKKKPQQAQSRAKHSLTRAEYDDLRQIDWFYVDPYIDL